MLGEGETFMAPQRVLSARPPLPTASRFSAAAALAAVAEADAAGGAGAGGGGGGEKVRRGSGWLVLLRTKQLHNVSPLRGGQQVCCWLIGQHIQQASQPAPAC